MSTSIHFAIYQLFIDTKFEERNLLVGFVQAVNTHDAIEVYLAATYADDINKREFIKAYLSAKYCSSADVTSKELSEAIKRNKKELGIWQ